MPFKTFKSSNDCGIQYINYSCYELNVWAIFWSIYIWIKFIRMFLHLSLLFKKKPFISVSYHTIKSILRSLSCWLDIWLNIYTCFMYRTSFPFRYWRIIKLSTISEHKPNNEHISQYVAFVEEVRWLRKLCYHLPNISFGRFFSWTGLVIKLSVLECTFL